MSGEGLDGAQERPLGGKVLSSSSNKDPAQGLVGANTANTSSNVAVLTSNCSGSTQQQGYASAVATQASCDTVGHLSRHQDSQASDRAAGSSLNSSAISESVSTFETDSSIDASDVVVSTKPRNGDEDALLSQSLGNNSASQSALTNKKKQKRNCKVM